MKSLFHILLAGIFVLASTLALTSVDAEAQEPAGDDVIAVLNASPDHNVFAELIEDAQLTETLRQPGPFTVLAPTDEAFEPLSGELDQLKEDPQQLQNILINHLFQGEASSAEVEENFGIEVEDGDHDASNGVVHSIDEVLIER